MSELLTHGAIYNTALFVRFCHVTRLGARGQMQLSLRLSQQFTCTRDVIPLISLEDSDRNALINQLSEAQSLHWVLWYTCMADEFMLTVALKGRGVNIYYLAIASRYSDLLSRYSDPCQRFRHHSCYHWVFHAKISWNPSNPIQADDHPRTRMGHT